MSKNIYITEGRKGRRFGSVKKLKTELQGGGSCLWVPEDDVQLDPLFATENGVYIPDEYGFSDASVNVFDGNIGSLDADNNWPYFPDSDLDGYGKVDVNVPEEQQNTFTDAIQISTLGNNPNRQYLWTMFYIHTESDPNGEYSTRQTMTFESAFPPYVYTDGEGKKYMCAFVRGNGSIRVYINWDNYIISQPGDEFLPHAYLHNCVIEYNLPTPSGTAIGGVGNPMRSKYTADGDVLENHNPGNAVLIEEHGHLAAIGSFFVSAAYHQNISTFRAPGTGEIQVRRIIRGVKTPHGSGYFYTSRVLDIGDYRIIHGMPFQSGQEWLDYCRTH